MNNLMQANNISGGYGNNLIIKDLSFDITKGDFLGIIGPNGSGKSTLLYLMTRIIYPENGKILFEDKDISKIKLKELYKKISFVPQNTTVNFPFTVEEIVLMGRIPHLDRMKLETKKDHEIVEKALHLTNTFHLKNKNIDNLSAGERQRVFIAKALAQEPVLLFLDEPTSHLDISYQIQILDLLRKLNQEEKLTIVIILHDLNLAGEYCKQLILINDGKIFKYGKPDEVLTYQNIESVYKTVVVVNKNPISKKPYILLVSKDSYKN